jgi:UBX domain-containing protein 1
MPGPVTLGDLGRRDAANDDGERDNEFYTGGAQSGMAVQDPNSGRGRGGGGAGRGEFIQGVFDSAREHGAEGPPEAVPRVVYFWDNGFSVDDGPLRSLEDPANRSFVEALQQGQCPRELAPEDPNQPVNVNLVRKSGDYVEPPKPKYVAFGGGGRSLLERAPLARRAGRLCGGRVAAHDARADPPGGRLAPRGALQPKPHSRRRAQLYCAAACGRAIEL